MGYYNKGGYDDSSSTDLAWDLRRIYAEKILGLTLQKIQVARNTENYPLWFHLLKRDLFTEISHKIDEDEEKDIKELIKKTRDVLAKYPNAYIGKSKNSVEHEQVEYAICELERALLRMMEEHHIFGSKDDDEGL